MDTFTILQQALLNSLVSEICKVAGIEQTETETEIVKVLLLKCTNFKDAEETIAKHYQIFNAEKRLHIGLLLAASQLAVKNLLVPLLKKQKNG